YWPADGNANDIVGGNDGTLHNGASYRQGIDGQAFSFDGIDDLMDAPANGLPTGDHPRTLAMWARVDMFLSQISTFGSYGGSGVRTRTFGVLANGIFPSFTNWGRSWEASENPLKTGKWYHFAATFENGSMSLYLNGKLVVTQSVVLDTAP